MNTIELKQKKSDDRTPLEVFEEAVVGRAFRVLGSAGETVAMKCFVRGKNTLMDLQKGYSYYDDGDKSTPFADGQILIIPIDIKITEL